MRIEKSAGLRNSIVVAELLPEALRCTDRKGHEFEAVFIGCFTNCRECGYTFMCHASNCKSFTFCVYEHRNSDGIVINGKEGCISNSGDLPYTSDSKWDDLSSFNCGEYHATARKLAELINKFMDDNIREEAN